MNWGTINETHKKNKKRWTEECTPKKENEKNPSIWIQYPLATDWIDIGMCKGFPFFERFRFFFRIRLFLSHFNKNGNTLRERKKATPNRLQLNLASLSYVDGFMFVVSPCDFRLFVSHTLCYAVHFSWFLFLLLRWFSFSVTSSLTKFQTLLYATTLFNLLFVLSTPKIESMQILRPNNVKVLNSNTSIVTTHERLTLLEHKRLTKLDSVHQNFFKLPKKYRYFKLILNETL